jgi:hypothetical protein
MTIVGMVVAEVVVEGMMEVESAMVVLKVAVVDISVVVVVDMAENLMFQWAWLSWHQLQR